MVRARVRAGTGGRGRRAAIVVLLFAAALIPRLYHVRSPYMNFADHNTANFSIFARNYVEHGWIGTRLAQARNAGPSTPDALVLFAHHPPTIALLTSVVFAVFGASEPAARALPLLLSAATCPLVYLLGRRIVPERWSILAAGLFALAPGAAYFGQMLDHESFVTFAGLLAIYAWCRHVETGRGGPLALMAALVAVTVLLDWPGVYLAPALAISASLSPRGRPGWRRVALLSTLAAAAALALVVLHIRWLTGSLDDLRASLSMRVLSTPELHFTWGEYLHRMRLNAEAALTPVLAWAAAGGALLTAVGPLPGAFGRGRRAGTVGPAQQGSAGPVPVFTAVAIFGGLHHVIFTNACHYNEHLVYYTLPGAVLLLAAGVASLERLVAAWALPRLAIAVAASAVLIPAVSLARDAGPHYEVYFDGSAYPGWPLLGIALNRIVPEEGRVMSDTVLSNPQFTWYLWRFRGHEARDPSRLTGLPGEVLMWDRNTIPGPGMERRLAGAAAAPVLNFTLYATAAGAPPPEIPTLAPPDAAWEQVEERFGDHLLLTMHRIAPREVQFARLGAIDTFLGVPWRPDRAAGRIVHGSFVWERLSGRAAALEPEYDLVAAVDGRERRAARMWPLPREAADLAGVEAGGIVRHEVAWFLGEGLPPGAYEIRVTVRDGRPLPPATREGRDPSPWLSLGRVRVRAGPGR